MDRQDEIRDAVIAALETLDGDRTPLDLVEEIPLLESVTEDVIAERVAAARAQGLSWSAIALRLGISRQAAHKRFGKAPKRRGRARIELKFERTKRNG